MVYQKFSRRQKMTLVWWKTKSFGGRDGIICDGSIRSGKTVSMTVGFILQCLEQIGIILISINPLFPHPKKIKVRPIQH